RAITQRLNENTVPATSVATLRYYRDAGLLNAKTLEQPDALQIYSTLPTDESDGRRFFVAEGNVNVAFDINPESFEAQGADPSQSGLMVRAYVSYQRKGG